jgi:predicted RNA-binding protein
MCEFTVILIENGIEKRVAEDIVKTSYQNGELVLYDVLGDQIPVKNAIIREVNVDSETLRIQRHEIIGSFIQFLEAYRRCKESGCHDEVKDAWEKVRYIGESMLKEISSTKE